MPPRRSRTTANKRTKSWGRPSRRTLPSISEVGESHHTSKPSRECGRPERDQQKRLRYERSPNLTRRTYLKKNRSIEIGPFARWIQGVAPDPALKIPQFVLYSGQSRPLEHICRYKSIMCLVTNDEAYCLKPSPTPCQVRRLPSLPR